MLFVLADRKKEESLKSRQLALSCQLYFVPFFLKSIKKHLYYTISSLRCLNKNALQNILLNIGKKELKLQLKDYRIEINPKIVLRFRLSGHFIFLLLCC